MNHWILGALLSYLLSDMVYGLGWLRNPRLGWAWFLLGNAMMVWGVVVAW